MLKKVLKYDCRTLFRIWWIAAVVTVAMSVLGGFAQTVYQREGRVPEIITVTAGMAMFFAYLCMVLLVILSEVLVFMRYYRNFFTDEGYLTFTLPVKRETLLNSKILSGLALMAASGGVCILGNFLMFFISDFELFRTGEYFRNVASVFREIPVEIRGYLLVYLLEALLILGLLLILSLLFLYCCITFGSMIVKKGKLLASIGIYFGAHSIFSFNSQLLTIFGTASIGVWMDDLSLDATPKIVILLLLAIILLLAVFSALIYAFTYWMLGRKLNLN
jgi:hypothetical protein